MRRTFDSELAPGMPDDEDDQWEADKGPPTRFTVRITTSDPNHVHLALNGVTDLDVKPEHRTAAFMAEGRQVLWVWSVSNGFYAVEEEPAAVELTFDTPAEKEDEVPQSPADRNLARAARCRAQS